MSLQNIFAHMKQGPALIFLEYRHGSNTQPVYYGLLAIAVSQTDLCDSFSQDTQLIDRQLPPAILAISNRESSPAGPEFKLMNAEVFKLLVQSILLFSAQKLMSFTLPICVATVYLVQRIYLRTSRQLRLLDLESQSAVYSSFLESVRYTAFSVAISFI